MALNHCSACKLIIFLALQKLEPSPSYFNGTIPGALPAPYLNCAGETSPTWLCGLSFTRGRTVKTESWELAHAIAAHTGFPLISDSASNKPGVQPWTSGPPLLHPMKASG